MKSKLLIILPLLILLVLAGCDSDNSSNAQVGLGDPNASSCPCFSAQDITDAAATAQKNSIINMCAAFPTSMGLSVDLFSDSTLEVSNFVVSCSMLAAYEPGPLCGCEKNGGEVMVDPLTKDQYVACYDLLVHALSDELGDIFMGKCEVN